MSRRRYAKSILTACILSLFLCGCEKTEVDYNLETPTETLYGESPLEMENREKWEEEFLVSMGSEKISVEISASVGIPEAEQMSVVELQEAVLDESYKKQIIELLFGHTQVYSEDEEDWPKARWQSMIDELESIVNDTVADMKAAENGQAEAQLTQEEYQYILDWNEKELAVYREKIKSAPEDSPLLSDFSGESFLGSFRSKDYYLSISEEKLYFIPYDNINAMGDDVILSYALGCHGVEMEKYASENKCTLSEEEAKREVEELLRTFGWSDPIWSKIQVLYWNNIADKEPFVNGYYFECTQGADGVAFGKFDSGYEGYGAFYYDSYEKKATIYIDDSGIISISLDIPGSFIQKTENVNLLPFDTIKGIIRKELDENAEKYLMHGTSIKFNEMELNYMPVKDKNREGYYSYVPAWRLCCSNTIAGYKEITGQPLIINAMDGTVIPMEDIRLGEKENE